MGNQLNDIDQRSGRETALGIMLEYQIKDWRDNTAIEAASATAVVAAVEPAAAGTTTTHTLVANKPDVPRNITMVLTDANASITEIVGEIWGTDQWGEPAYEKLRLTAAGTATGNQPFGTINKITSKVVSGTVTGGADTVSFGMGSKIGIPIRCERNSDIVAKRSESAGTHTLDSSTTNVNFQYQTWTPTVAPDGTKTHWMVFRSKYGTSGNRLT